MERTIITPPRRTPLPPFRDMWRAREVFWRFGMRDIVLRYRQTVVGVAWVVLQPLVGAGIFSIIFGQVAKLPSGGLPYFVFSFAGLLAWGLFSGVVTRASTSLVANQSLVSKIFFPRLLIPLSSLLSVLLDFVVGLALMVVLLFVYHVNPGWPILLLPVWIVFALLLGLGIGIAAAALMVKYRDVGYVLPWIIQILFYITPVAYSLSAVPPNLLWLFNANPLTWMMEAFRWSLLGLDAPPLWQLLGLAVASLAVMAVGLMIFQKLERGFADVI